MIDIDDVPRSDAALREAKKYRTWIGRSLCMSSRMMQIEREFNHLRAAALAVCSMHKADACELCAVLAELSVAEEEREHEPCE